MNSHDVARSGISSGFNGVCDPLHLQGWQLRSENDSSVALPSVTLLPGGFLLILAEGTGALRDGGREM